MDHNSLSYEELELRIKELELENTRLKAEQSRISKEKNLCQKNFDDFPTLIWRSDTNKSRKYFNIEWLNFTGRTLEQEIENGWKEGVHKDDITTILHIFNTSFDQQKPYTMDYRLLHKSGEYHWIRDFGRPLYDAHNTFTGYISSCFDIDKDKENELQLLATRKKYEENAGNYQSLFSLMQEGVYLHKIVYNSEGQPVNYRIIDANPISEKYLNIRPEDAIGKLATELYRVEVAPYLDTYAKVAETAEPYIFEQYFPPMEKYFLISVFSPQKGEFATVFLDITESKSHERELILAKELTEKSEQQLQLKNEELKRINIELVTAKEQAEENEEKFKTIFETSMGLICVADIETATFTLVNPAFKSLLGYERNELLSRPFFDFIHPDDIEPTQQVVENELKAGKIVIQFMNRYRDKNGEYHWLDWNSHPMPEKGITYAVAYDITERKKVEQKLIKAVAKAEESNRLKTAFLQNLSHEIRTPLNAICGFSGMLNKPGISENKRNNFVSIIETSSNQLLSIVSDVLTISALETKQEKLNIDKVSINSIILDLLAIFKQQSHNQNISLYARQTLNIKQSEIFTDKTKITQILTNLISNALKFTSEGFVEFGYTLKNDMQPAQLEFYVRDSGVGIKPEFHHTIFERFRQADLSLSKKYGGTGLGLSISKGFVELLGGKIWVDSEPEVGSAFYFTIPYKPVHISENQTAPKEHKKPTILIAEDEEFNFLFIEELLREFDYKIIHAKNGEEAVKIVSENVDLSLILMDIKMPVMDGDTAAKIIKQKKTGMPIIAQSAYALEHEIEQYNDVFDDYLTKPINEGLLVRKVQQYLQHK